MEDPFPVTRADVVAADVALDVPAARRSPARAVGRTHEDDVATHDRGAVPADLSGEEIDLLIGVLLEVDDPSASEARNRTARPRVERDKLIADRDEEDAFVALPVRPIGDPPTRHTPDGAFRPLSLVDPVHPQDLARVRVERDDVPPASSGRVEHPVDHEGRGLVVVVRIRPEIARIEAPRHLEIREVGSVDLIERSVPRAPQIARIGRPLAAHRAGLGRRVRSARRHDRDQ